MLFFKDLYFSFNVLFFPPENMASIKYVKELTSQRSTEEDYSSVTFEELDSWTYNDFVQNGFYETLKNAEYVHLYFDFDFSHSDDTLIKVLDVINRLDSIKHVFGDYYYAGYCFHDDELESNIYDKLPEDFRKCIVKKTVDYGKDISFHVVFPDTRILKNDLWEIMTSKNYNNPFSELTDTSVYKKLGMDQLFRHPYSKKYGAKDKKYNKDVNPNKMITKVQASKLVATCKGSERIVTKEQWLAIFQEKPVQPSPAVKFSDTTSKLLLTDDIAFGGEEMTANNDITKEMFELLYKGIVGLTIHGDEEKTDKEITLFPLMSGLYSCVGKDGITESDVRDALDVIRDNNTLTPNANKKWSEKRKQAENNKNCRGPGALFNYVKNFNSEYYTEHILPVIKPKATDEIKFDLKDNFSIKNIRENGFNSKYQVNGDKERLDYTAVLNDLRKVLIVIDQGEGLYVLKERDSENNRMTVNMYNQKTIFSMLKQLKVGTELKPKKYKEDEEHIYETKTAFDVFNASTNNKQFYKSGITFYSENPDDFSFYQGLKYNAAQNDNLIQAFNNHIKHIWCKDNEELYTYVQSWFATILQQPLGRCYTALVVKGAEGTGKNAITDVWAELLSGYANSNVSDIDSIVGKFNTAVENKKLLVCNEMDSADMNSTAVFNRLKKLITENVIDINTKNVSVRTGVQNVSNYVFVSNEFNPVKISSTDRRYCILTPSEEVRGDFQYFEKLFASMKHTNGGYKRDFMEAIMYYYMNYKVTINLRNIPETLERVIARESNKSAIESFVEEYCLELAEDGLTPIACYDMFCNFAARNGFKSTYKRTTFKAEMTKYCEVDSDGQLHRYKMQRVYRFTDAARKQFARVIKQKQEDVHDSIKTNFDLGDSDSDIPVKGTVE